MNRKPVAPLYAFESTRLQGEGGLDCALELCIDSIKPDNFGLVVEDLLTVHNSLQLVISVVGDDPPLCAWIMDTFPTSPNLFATSLAFRILDNMSLFFLFLDYPFSDDIKDDIRQHRRSVELGAQVILALVALLDPKSGVFGRDPEEDKRLNMKRNRETQRSVKRAKNVKYLFDDTPFRKFGVAVPDNRGEAEMLVLDILTKQRAAMEFYLSNLQRAGVSEVLRQLFAAQSAPASTVVERVPRSKAPTNLPVLESTQDRSPSAYPIVRPVKAALYFENAEGFGEWKIWVSSSMTKDLRETCSKNPELFDITLRKIRELSKGHFSDDNHKKLNGSKGGIPIYEAKMTRDSRLVYTIDVVQDYDGDFERQIIRIFGIYTHAQLNTRSWVSLGRYLERKGREYKRRCTFRQPAYNPGDSVIPPATFPDRIEIVPESSDPLQLPSEDPDILHSILVLNKYVTFSQEFLNSILVGHDVNHVFHVSPQEKTIIEHSGSCYVLGRSGTGKTTTMLFKMLGLERSWIMESHENDAKKPRQIFVTKSRILANKVSGYFAKLLESLSTAGLTKAEVNQIAEKKKYQQWQATLMINPEDEKVWNEDMPAQYSLLRDEHFPLFITFDDLCDLIEGDIDIAEGVDDSNQNSARAARKHRTSLQKPIAYSDFLQFYWPHFTQSLTKGMSHSLVFSEIMGTIQGSLQALMCKQRFLDQSGYEELSVRAQPLFASQRNALYALFRQYLKLKRERREFDAADRAHLIVDYMRKNGIPGQKIDFLYVDEAQDNLLIDIFVLRSLCSNPDGLFWAGDTAQTISIGSSFRFDDLKALLFRIEHSDVQQRRSTQPSSTQPKTFKLTVNYRSHGGIINAAHSVIQLITRFWPYTIDNLPQEKGIVDGLKPVFFHGWDRDTVRYEQFLFGESGKHAEFGATQCILVRHPAARDKLREEVGNIGIILTIYEAKGLEFEDVLLYNFFEDSLVEHSQWRVVLNAIEDVAIAAPNFDENHHAGVCSELKSLYVAITRARKNMWIADCSQKSNPMRAFWDSKNLVRNCTPADDVPGLAVSSSTAEWAEQGTNLFQNQRYLQAVHCFERASQPRRAAVTNAFFLRERARNTPITQRNATERTNAFLEAADAFLACDAEVVKEKLVYFRNAGECFTSAGNNRKAAESFVLAEEFTKAAESYHRCRMVDEAVNIIQSHRDQVQPDVADTITRVAGIFYFREKKMARAKQLFSSLNEALEFTEDYDLDVARGTLLESMGRLADAAELHLEEGRTMEAIDLFLKDSENPNSRRRAYECVLQGLWHHISFGVLPNAFQANETATKLLGFAVEFERGDLLRNETDSDQIAMFQAIHSGDLARLQRLGLKFDANGNFICALMCLDHYFSQIPHLDTLGHVALLDVLNTFQVYAWLLHTFSWKDPCRNQSVQKLFGIRISSSNAFSLLAGTFLHQAQQKHLSLQEPNSAALVTAWDLPLIFRAALRDRLKTKVSEENSMCRRAKAISPCIVFCSYGQCRENCTSEHCRVTPKVYNIRVRLHLIQILIYQTLQTIEGNMELTKQRSHWLSRLYDALNPAYPTLGTRAVLDLTQIPEADRALRVVEDWVRHIFYGLNAHRAPGKFLTLFLHAADFCFAPGITVRRDYINRLRYIYRPMPTEYLRGPGARNIMHDLLHYLNRSQPACLSAGVLFLEQVVKKMLPIDISALCKFVDQLCMSYILNQRYRRTGSLHGILLPRNWLLALVGLSDDIRKWESHYFIFILVDVLAHLLRRVYAIRIQGQGLQWLSKDLSERGPAILAIFSDRICTALCLLGYNVNILGLRDKITTVIKSMKEADGHFLPYCRSRYAYARDWDSLVLAVQGAVQDSECDEMIELCHTSKALCVKTAIRQVVYRTVNEIPSRIWGAKTPPKSSLSANATPFIPTIRAVPLVKNSNDVTQDNLPEPTPQSLSEKPGESRDSNIDNTAVEEEYVDDPTSDVTEEAGDSKYDVTANNEGLINDLSQPIDPASGSPSEEEIRAADIIRNVYRRVLSRRKGIAKAGLDASRAAIYDACLAESRKMDWPKRPYRLLFLGPLVHALLCLDVIETHVNSLKTKLKKRSAVAEYQALEAVQKSQTELTGIQKVAKRLRQQLRPQSEMHRKRDTFALKECIRELEGLEHRLTSTGPIQKDLMIRFDMRLAVKGIVQDRSTTKKPKPELCIDEDEQDFI